MRFIEFMRWIQRAPGLKRWSFRQGVAGAAPKTFRVATVADQNSSSTAKRWAFADGGAEIGIIAPVSEPFCGHCNRIRLTADGKIRTCLFSVAEHDLRSVLRNDASDGQIEKWLESVVYQKEARHHIGEPDSCPLHVP